MCIIAVSDYKTRPLEREVLERCFNKNPDGAGFAYYIPDEELWAVEKGFMTFNEFWEGYSAHQFKTEDYVVCHFRVGTSGLKDAGNTHPFPVTNNVDTMRELKFKTPSLLIHNGVIGKGEAVPSDTMCFVRDYVYPLLRFATEEPRLLEILEEESETKRCRWFITIGGDIYQWGEWHTSTEGWEFSNKGYEAPPLKTTMIPWQGNNTANPQSGSSPAPVGKKHFSDYYNSAGFFDNEAWKNDIKRNLGMVVPKEDPKPTVLMDDMIVVSSTTDEEDFVYGVLSDDGVITVWDKASDPKDGVTEPAYLFCPECFEDRHLMDSPYEGQGDTLCYHCGAIFWDGTGQVVSYDDEYRKIYLERVAQNEITKAKQAAIGGE